MVKNNDFKYIIFLLITIIISVLSIPITVYLTNHFVTEGDNDWIGYMGNIVGGVFGGIFTLLGVKYAFSLEKKKASIESIPEKIIHLNKIRSEINSQKFEFDLDINSAFDLTNSKLKKFLECKQNLLEFSSKVNIDIYVSVTKYFSSLEIMKYELEKIRFKLNSDNQEEIALELKNMYVFHTEIIRDLVQLIGEVEKKYTYKLYDQKYPKHIIEQYNSKEFIKNIKDEIN